MSDCNCDNCDSDDEENSEEKKYSAFMMAGELAVDVEGEDSGEAGELAKHLWDKAIDDVQNLSEDERRSIGLK